MANFLFSVTPAKPRAVTPGDIDLDTFANRSTFPGLRVAPDVNLTLVDAIVNISTFPVLDIYAGPAEGEFNETVFTNISTFPGLTVSVSPPDGTLRVDLFTNSSSFPLGTEVDLAPTDGTLRETVFSNVSTFPGITVSEDVVSDDESIVADYIVGDVPV